MKPLEAMATWFVASDAVILAVAYGWDSGTFACGEKPRLCMVGQAAGAIALLAIIAGMGAVLIACDDA